MKEQDVSEPSEVSDGVTYEQQATADPLLQYIDNERVERDQALREKALAASKRTISFRNLGETSDLLEIRNPDGQVELEVVLTDKGPVLRFNTASLQLDTRNLQVNCDTFQVNAEKEIVQQSKGDFRRTVKGDSQIESGGSYSARAFETDIRSSRGDVRIRANDNVRLNGERVKLNCQ